MDGHANMLAVSIQKICRERNLDETLLRTALCDFLRSLHETQFKSDYRPEDGSLIAQVHRSLGDEAGFHFVGLLASSGKGLDAGTVYDTLEYLDSTAKRFGTTVQRWQMEIDNEIVDNM